MCGFAGLFTTAGFTGDELAGHARRMIAPIAHRGPDDSGLWVDEQAGIALGFRRLAILDLTPAGHQPMRSASGRYVIVFNGEVYNFDELRDELQRRGSVFRGGSDTEVILAAFEHWGIREAVPRFVGMFAIAVWDSMRRELSLIRDRIGKKPLYVYREPGMVAFGSELKALLAGPSFDRTVDRQALASYLRYLYVPAPKTIYQRASKLPAAHIQTIADPRRELPAPHCYWSLHDAARNGLANPLSGSDAELLDELDAVLGDAVRCRLRSDVPLGALLSGGIDSSTVVAYMQEAGGRPVKTFTIGFVEEDANEAQHAAKVAAHLGTDHTDLILTGEDAHALVPAMADTFDEPFADPSQLPTLLVSKLARRDVTVALCGDGGDEMFGGYNRYVYGARVVDRVRRIPAPVRRLAGACIEHVPAPVWDRAYGLAAAIHPGLPRQHFGERVHKVGHLLNAASPGDMYRSLLSAWQRPDEVLAGASQEDEPGLLPEHTPENLFDRMMLSDQLTYLPDDLLAKVDRASMAVSLEVRAPLLDHRLIEFSWRMPRAMKLRDGVGKWALRQVLYRRVPRNMVERPKMGFSVPIDRWLRGPLRAWGQALLADDGPSALREPQGRPEHGRGTGSGHGALINMEAARRAWQDLQEGRRQAGTALWAVLMFQAWRTRWLA